MKSDLRTVRAQYRLHRGLGATLRFVGMAVCLVVAGFVLAQQPQGASPSANRGKVYTLVLKGFQAPSTSGQSLIVSMDKKGSPLLKEGKAKDIPPISLRVAVEEPAGAEPIGVGSWWLAKDHSEATPLGAKVLPFGMSIYLSDPEATAGPEASAAYLFGPADLAGTAASRSDAGSMWFIGLVMGIAVGALAVAYLPRLFAWFGRRGKGDGSEAYTPGPVSTNDLSYDLRKLSSDHGETLQRIRDISVAKFPSLSSEIKSCWQDLRVRADTVASHQARSDESLRRVEDNAQGVRRELGDLNREVARLMQRLEGAERSVEALGLSIEKGFADQSQHMWPPFEPATQSMLQRAGGLLTYAEQLGRDPALPADAAFLEQCAGELRDLIVVLGRLEGNENPYGENDLDFLLPRVYAPSRVIDVAVLSRSGAMLCTVLQLRIDELRRDLKEALHSKVGLQAIEVVPGKTRFAPELHEDNAIQQLPAKTPSSHNLVFECNRPGFTLRGKVLRKAYVRRFVSPTGSSQGPVGAPQHLQFPQESVPPTGTIESVSPVSGIATRQYAVEAGERPSETEPPSAGPESAGADETNGPEEPEQGLPPVVGTEDTAEQDGPPIVKRYKP